MASSPGTLCLHAPDPSCLTLNDVFWQGSIIMMIVFATTAGGACPGREFTPLTFTVDIAARCAISLGQGCSGTHRLYCRASDCPPDFHAAVAYRGPTIWQTNLSTSQCGDRLHVGWGSRLSSGSSGILTFIFTKIFAQPARQNVPLSVLCLLIPRTFSGSGLFSRSRAPWARNWC
jgi:hypothetical protein